MAQPMNSNGLPHPGGHRKKRMAPKRKIRLQALVLILFLVIPGNLVTLIIYSSTNAGKYIWFYQLSQKLNVVWKLLCKVG